MNSEYSSRGVHTMTLTLWLSDSSTAMTSSYFSSAVHCGSVFSFVFLLLPQKSITNTMRSQNVGGEKKARIRARGEIGKRVIFILFEIIDRFPYVNFSVNCDFAPSLGLETFLHLSHSTAGWNNERKNANCEIKHWNRAVVMKCPYRYYTNYIYNDDEAG